MQDRAKSAFAKRAFSGSRTQTHADPAVRIITLPLGPGSRPLSLQDTRLGDQLYDAELFKKGSAFIESSGRVSLSAGLQLSKELHVTCRPESPRRRNDRVVAGRPRARAGLPSSKTADPCAKTGRIPEVVVGSAPRRRRPSLPSPAGGSGLHGAAHREHSLSLGGASPDVRPDIASPKKSDRQKTIENHKKVSRCLGLGIRRPRQPQE